MMARRAAIAADAKARALADLRMAAQALLPHLSTPDQQDELQLINDAIARLSREPAAPAGLRDFDASRLAHLLDLAGRDFAEELLARLAEDLNTTSDKLTLGATETDWALLRDGSHVLISLAGSVGAISLQGMAETLNALAHRQDREALPALMMPLSGELNALIDLVSQTTPTGTIR